jgi:hypothetical protein
MTDVTQTTGSDLVALLSDNQTPVTFRVPVIFDADGNDKSGFIIVGRNSQQYMSIQETIRVENVKRSSRTSTKIDTTTDVGAETAIKLADENERRTVVAVTVGWFGWQVQGTDAPFDPDTVVKMFEKYPTWQDKVNDALNKDSNFFKG